MEHVDNWRLAHTTLTSCCCSSCPFCSPPRFLILLQDFVPLRYCSGALSILVEARWLLDIICVAFVHLLRFDKHFSIPAAACHVIFLVAAPVAVFLLSSTVLVAYFKVFSFRSFPGSQHHPSHSDYLLMICMSKVQFSPLIATLAPFWEFFFCANPSHLRNFSSNTPQTRAQPPVNTQGEGRRPVSQECDS